MGFIVLSYSDNKPSSLFQALSAAIEAKNILLVDLLGVLLRE